MKNAENRGRLSIKIVGTLDADLNPCDLAHFSCRPFERKKELTTFSEFYSNYRDGDQIRRAAKRLFGESENIHRSNP